MIENRSFSKYSLIKTILPYDLEKGAERPAQEKNGF
jgi:hypothetical protein